MRVHNNTIRKYVQALLDILNDFEVQYITSDGRIINKKVPIVYGNREKQNMLDFVEQSFLESGNYQVLPRSYLRLVQLSKVEDRVQNKLIKTNINIQGDFQEFIFNPMPYEFVFEYSLMCRGMNEASQLIEAIQTKFNPSVEMDIWDQVNQTEPSRIPVRLMDISVEPDDYSDESMNIVMLNQSLQVNGSLYQPNNVDNRFVNKELEPCQTCEGECSCELPLVNARLMPVIKQVSYGMYVQGDLDKPTKDDVIRINLFDVDENGYLVQPDTPYDFEILLSEIRELVQRVLQKKELFDQIKPDCIEDMDELGKYFDDEDALQKEMTSVINRSKKIVFELKSHLKETTDQSTRDKINYLDSVIWGYDNTVQMLLRINDILDIT